MGIEHSRIAAVVWDLDDTLYLERDFVRSGYAAVARRLREVAGRSDRFEDWLWRRFCAGQAGGAMDALNREFALGLDERGIAELIEVYRFHEPDIGLIPGMEGLLGSLFARYDLGLLSDGLVRTQSAKLRALGVDKLFKAVVISEQVGAGKPSPAGYERIARELGVRPDACVYIADNPTKDFLAANALGWQSVQLLWPGQVYASRVAPAGGAPSAVAQSVGELSALLVG